MSQNADMTTQVDINRNPEIKKKRKSFVLYVSYQCLCYFPNKTKAFCHISILIYFQIFKSNIIDEKKH